MPYTVTRTYTVLETPPVSPETRYMITVTDDATGTAVQRAYGATRAIAKQELIDYGFVVAGA